MLEYGTVQVAKKAILVRIAISILVLWHGQAASSLVGYELVVGPFEELNILAIRKVKAVPEIDYCANDRCFCVTILPNLGLGPFERPVRISFPEIGPRSKPIEITIATPDECFSGYQLLGGPSVTAMITEYK